MEHYPKNEKGEIISDDSTQVVLPGQREDFTVSFWEIRGFLSDTAKREVQEAYRKLIGCPATKGFPCPENCKGGRLLASFAESNKPHLCNFLQKQYKASGWKTS